MTTFAAGAAVPVRAGPTRCGGVWVRLLLVLVLSALGVTVRAPSALAADGEGERRGDDNTAVAVNEADGSSIFDLAFSIRKVNDGVVDQTNTAVAYASCSDCQTVALAFQVVLVYGDVPVVTPENRSLAVNNECAECLTFASATQLVIGVDGPSRLTADGVHRLVALRHTLRALEDRVAQLSPAELAAEVSAVERELLTIFTDELVPAHPPSDRDTRAEGSGDPTTSSTTPDGSSGGAPGPTEPTTTTTSSTTSASVDTSTSSTTPAEAGGSSVPTAGQLSTSSTSP
jgi:putative peptide zinc metalloprotease protein